jgi:hypothetical protein
MADQPNTTVLLIANYRMAKPRIEVAPKLEIPLVIGTGIPETAYSFREDWSLSPSAEKYGDALGQ